MTAGHLAHSSNRNEVFHPEIVEEASNDVSEHRRQLLAVLTSKIDSGRGCENHTAAQFVCLAQSAIKIVRTEWRSSNGKRFVK